MRKRLVRDYPAIYATYMAGELSSVRAAAVAAGLVHRRPRAGASPAPTTCDRRNDT